MAKAITDKVPEVKAKRPGRPKDETKPPGIPGQVTTSLFDNEYDKLKRISKDKGLSFATMMRIISDNYLEDFPEVSVEDGIVVYSRGPAFEAKKNKLLRVSFILTPEQKMKLEKLAVVKKVSESAILRSMVKHFLAGTTRIFKIRL